MSNRAGLAALDYLRTGDRHDELVSEFSERENTSKTDGNALINDTISTWQSAGLLEESKRPFPGETPHRAPTKAAVTTCYSMAGQHIRLRSENIDLAAQVNVLLAPYRDKDQPEAAIVLDALQTADGILVFVDQKPVWGLANEDEARYLILRETIEALCGADNVAAVLHAGCAAQNGSGILLAGFSGSGKSTLTLGLVDGGWTYVGDDLIALKCDGANAIALPMPAGLKFGSRRLNAIQNLRREDAIEHPSPRTGVEYLLPRRVDEQRNEAEIGALIFPTWGADLKCKISPVLPEDAFSHLIQSGSELSRRDRSVAPLANLLNKVPSYALQYSEMKEAVQACCDLCVPVRV